MMKSNKALARKILCGLLAAGVLGVSGSALAANYSNNEVGPKTESNLSVTKVFSNAKGATLTVDNLKMEQSDSEIWNRGNLTINKLDMTGKAIKNFGTMTINDNIGTKETKNNIFITSSNNDHGTIVAPATVTINGNVFAHNINIQGNANQFTIKGDTVVSYLQVYDTTANFKVEKNLTIDNLNHWSDVRGNITVGDTLTLQQSVSFGISDSNENTVKLTAKKLVVETPDGWARFYSTTDALDIPTVEIKDGAWIQACTNDEFKIGTLNVTNGKLTTWNKNYEQDNGTPGTTSIKINELNIGDNGSLMTYEQTKGGSSFEVGTLNMGNNAVLQNGNENEKAKYKSFVGEKALTIDKLDTGSSENAKINNQGEIKIGETAGNSLKIFNETLQDKVTIERNSVDKLEVTANADLVGANLQSGMQQIADTVEIKDGNKEKFVKADSGTILGEITGKTDANGKFIVSEEKANEFNQGISEMSAISLMTWRQENNDMNKRLGELRDSKGEHGAWARMARGESKYGAQNVTNQYNYYQVGYDEKLSVDPNWTVGVALTRTEGNSTFATGSGENKHTGVAVYGSYLNDNGSFIDLIAKYARMDNDFSINGGVGSGSYGINGYSLSAEYGKRFTQDNGFWIEPQVELTYGKVGSVDYVAASGAEVRQNGMESLVGRLGFSMGKNIKQGNVYVRASYLYDFDGETDVAYSFKGMEQGFEQDLGGGWWEVGVGTNLNLSEATHLYFDVEKTYGGNVATPWQWNAGVRWSF